MDQTVYPHSATQSSDVTKVVEPSKVISGLNETSDDGEIIDVKYKEEDSDDVNENVVEETGMHLGDYEDDKEDIETEKDERTSKDEVNDDKGSSENYDIEVENYTQTANVLESDDQITQDSDTVIEDSVEQTTDSTFVKGGLVDTYEFITESTKTDTIEQISEDISIVEEQFDGNTTEKVNNKNMDDDISIAEIKAEEEGEVKSDDENVKDGNLDMLSGKLTDFKKMPPLPDESKLPPLPSLDELGPLPDIKDLPPILHGELSKLNKKEMLPFPKPDKLPDIHDLPPLPGIAHVVPNIGNKNTVVGQSKSRDSELNDVETVETGEESSVDNPHHETGEILETLPIDKSNNTEISNLNSAGTKTSVNQNLPHENSNPGTLPSYEGPVENHIDDYHYIDGTKSAEQELPIEKSNDTRVDKVSEKENVPEFNTDMPEGNADHENGASSDDYLWKPLGWTEVRRKFNMIQRII